MVAAVEYHPNGAIKRIEKVAPGERTVIAPEPRVLQSGTWASSLPDTATRSYTVNDRIRTVLNVAIDEGGLRSALTQMVDQLGGHDRALQMLSGDVSVDEASLRAALARATELYGIDSDQATRHYRALQALRGEDDGDDGTAAVGAVVPIRPSSGSGTARAQAV